MNDNTNETARTEPIPTAATTVTEQPAEPATAASPLAPPVGAPASSPGRGNRAAMIAGAAGIALVLTIGVFAVGVGVGSRLGGPRGGQQYALSGQQAAGEAQRGGRGVMPGTGLQQGQMGGRGLDGDDDRESDGHRGRPGDEAPQGFGGQGTPSPTAPVPAVPGQ